MTAGATAPEATSLPMPVETLLRQAGARFVDLGYLAPDGQLDLPVRHDGVIAIRLELPAGQSLQLQSLLLDADGVDDVAGLAEVRTSSTRSHDAPAAVDLARLFDFDRPTGTVIATDSDKAWAEVRFERPITITRLRLRNVSGEAARRSGRGLKISVRTRWRSRLVYDGGAQLRAWRELVRVVKAQAGIDPETEALLDVLDLTVRADYGRAHTTLASHVHDEQERRRLRAAVDAVLLAPRGFAWTTHGPQRPFRVWSAAEQVDYVRDSAAVVDALRSLSPNVCFGFGSVLSIVRDRALIPHDDDLDIVIAFEPEEALTLADGLRSVEDHLRPLGYEVGGRFSAHRHVRRPGRKHVDVFAGVFEGESISWYPGARGGLTRAIVFPPMMTSLLGIPCTVPAQPEVYLERLYGPGWRVPDPDFSHAWDVSAYADIVGTSQPVSEAETAGSEPPEAS